jgi:ubiquinone/menaquinone biosynthesis C-methylase UbiE
MAVDLDKQAVNRAVWSAGEWDRVADYVAGTGPKLLDAVGISDGMRVLDIGTGSGGSVAIPAAKLGADVVGSDISSVHFDAARARAEAAGVEVEWVEADALDLPFEDGSFDRVLSTFGHMFAPDHAQAASEMVRVTKPDGAIGFCCWTPEGATGRMFRIVSSHMPAPPEGFQPPPLWGTEDHVRSLMEPLGVELEFDRLMNEFREESLEMYQETFQTNFGPMVMARQALGEEGWPALKEELDAFAAEENEADDGSVLIRGEYLQTIGRRS